MRRRQAALIKDLLLDQLVLDATQCGDVGIKLATRVLNDSQGVWIEKLVFNGHNVNLTGEFQQLLWIIPIAHERSCGKLRCRTVLFSIQNHDFATKLQCRLSSHLRKLTAANDPEAGE